MENACAYVWNDSWVLRVNQGPCMDCCSLAHSRTVLTVGRTVLDSRGMVGCDEDEVLFCT